MLSLKQIAEKRVQLTELEEQVQSLQTPIAEPNADNYSSEYDFLQARRHWQGVESRRVDDLATKTSFLASQKSKLQAEEDQLEPVKTKVDKTFAEYRAAALEANQILNQAEEAIAKVLEISKKLGEQGYQSVYDVSPLDVICTLDLPIFAVLNAKNNLRVSVWGRAYFKDMQRIGSVGEGTET
jgi:vacuolar-type H+-ATPase subunit I/STV1